MGSHFNIRYLKHSEIDKIKWDQCISRADNGLIYAWSLYLDHMAKHWDALVFNDYEAVMPLTWNRKYGIYYLYQPFLTAQLGVFGKHLSPALIETFLQSIPPKFRYWDFYLNHQNVFSSENFKLYNRRNFVLDLDNSYEKINKTYRENIQRNIRKAEKSGCKLIKDFDIQKVINLSIKQSKIYNKNFTADINRFKKLYQYLHDNKQAITYGVVSSENELVASCVFTFSRNRAYYILVGNHRDGRKLGASHFLIDTFIKDHAGKKMVLDFEGSDIRSLALFYSGFGAKEENYAAIKLNRLPHLIKWIKK